MKRILFFSGSRADFGLLYPLIKKFQKIKKIKTFTYLGGHHFSKKYGYTFNEIDKLRITNKIKSKVILRNTNEIETTKYISTFLNEVKNNFIKIKPDLVVLLGDRYELQSVAITSFSLKIPILHLHGGELTQGAFDDVIRHVITKYSNYHFVSHNLYKKRVIQLGEQPQSIFNFGAIGAEIAKKSKIKSFGLLESKYNIYKKKYFLITIHPETNNLRNSIKYLDNLLKTVTKLTNFKCIFTANNNDTKGDFFIRKIKTFCKKNANSQLVYNLGSNEYFSLARYAIAVIGNSSSGVIEIPSLKTPTINIGKRQKGRIMGSSILNSNGTVSDLLKKINLIKKNKIKFEDTYYKKNTILNMKKMILKIISKKINQNKIFYDYD